MIFYKESLNDDVKEYTGARIDTQKPSWANCKRHLLGRMEATSAERIEQRKRE